MRNENEKDKTMAECMALACPRLRNQDYDNRDLSLNVPSTLIARTKTGQTFCNYCYKQRRLLDWAHANHYPVARVLCGQMYVSIANDEWNWTTSIIGSRQEVIDAFFDELIGDAMEEEQEEVKPTVRWTPKRAYPKRRVLV